MAEKTQKVKTSQDEQAQAPELPPLDEARRGRFDWQPGDLKITPPLKDKSEEEK